MPITGSTSEIENTEDLAVQQEQWLQAEALCDAMAAIHQRGWCDGTGGNFSVVVNRSPLRLLMAPSGVDKGSVRPGQLLLVDGAGSVLRGEGRSSAETLLHLAIVEVCGAGAVLHTHSQAGTLLSAWLDPADGNASGAREGTGGGVSHLEISDLEMLKGLEGVTSHEALVKVPVLSNDQDIRGLSERARPHLIAAPHGLLIAGHGLYAWGRDLAQARRHLEIHEFLLEQQWRRLLLAGLKPSRPSGGAQA